MEKARVMVQLIEQATRKRIETRFYEGDEGNIDRIAADVNYWLRIEVGPHWQPNTLHMEAVIHASKEASDALRYMLRGVAIAWRMAPSFDPEDLPAEN